MGNVLMSISLILLGIAVMTVSTAPPAPDQHDRAAVIYLAGYELGWGAVVWVMMSEMFPLKIRGVGMGTGSVVLWAATFAITFLFPVMEQHSAWPARRTSSPAISIVLFLLVASGSSRRPRVAAWNRSSWICVTG